MRSDKVDKKRKYPPAYYRYRQKHVTLSILLSNDLRGFLEHFKDEGLSYPDLIKDGLTKGERMSRVIRAELEDEFDTRINSFMKEKGREYEDKLERGLRGKEWEIRKELKDKIASDIAKIQDDLTRRIRMPDEVKGIIEDIFQDHGFGWMPSGPRMDFHDSEA